MADTDRKTEGPACACGKADLYEEWLKHNEEGKKEDPSTPTSQIETKLSSTIAAGNADKKRVQTKE
jgi:hypothetical protein